MTFCLFPSSCWLPANHSIETRWCEWKVSPVFRTTSIFVFCQFPQWQFCSLEHLFSIAVSPFLWWTAFSLPNTRMACQQKGRQLTSKRSFSCPITTMDGRSQRLKDPTSQSCRLREMNHSLKKPAPLSLSMWQVSVKNLSCFSVNLSSDSSENDYKSEHYYLFTVLP